MKNFSQIKRISLRDQIYEQLKMNIISLELEPGKRVNDKMLAEEFGVSRTPVREALKRLEDEGLIVSSPGSETKVSEVDQRQARDAFVVTATLHELAAELALPFLNERHADILAEINEQFRVAIHMDDRVKAVRLDDQFHEVILEAAANKEISVALERLMPKIRRLEMIRFNVIDGMESVNKHNEMITAIRNKDGKLPQLLKENWLSLSSQLTGEDSI